MVMAWSQLMEDGMVPTHGDIPIHRPLMPVMLLPITLEIIILMLYLLLIYTVSLQVALILISVNVM